MTRLSVFSKRISRLALSVALLMLAAVGVSADGEAVTDLNELGDQRYSCSYAGTSRSFLEVPAPSEAKGLIFMLHGAGGSAAGFKQQTAFDAAAGQRGYAVVYVDGLPNPADRTSMTGWNSGLTENYPVDDLCFLKALAAYFQEKYGLSPAETFFAGFSNGAFVIYRLATDAADSLRAVASVCGRMPEQVWSAKGEKATVGLLQISGTKDDVIPMRLNGTDKYSRSPAIEDVVDWFAETQGPVIAEEDLLAKNVSLFRYYDETRSQSVWHVIINGGHHGWPEEKYSGFDANGLILDFFDSFYA